MPNRKTHLGEAELEIMQILWSARQPQTAREILAQLQGKRPWALSTLMTALARLGEKGFVSCDRSTRTNLYTPKVSARDYQAQAGKHNAAGEKRMGADDNLGLPQCNGVGGLAALPSAQRAGQKNRSDAKRCHQRGQRSGMLFGQDFRGHHQSGLATAFGCTIGGSGGNHGLAAAHIALHQPVHGDWAGQIRSDLRDDPLLRAGELKRK